MTCLSAASAACDSNLIPDLDAILSGGCPSSLLLQRIYEHSTLTVLVSDETFFSFIERLSCLGENDPSSNDVCSICHHHHRTDGSFKYRADKGW